MAYTPKTWTDNIDIVSAAELNRMETGIDDADTRLSTLDLNTLTDVNLVVTPPVDGDRLVYDQATTSWKPLASATNTDASKLTTGELAIDRLPLGGTIVVDYYKAYYGAANAWPAARPTSRLDICVVWRGPSDPGTIAVAGDVIDLVG